MTSIDLKQYLKSSNDVKQRTYMIHGPPKHGKTFCAATISDQYSTGVISDTVWLTCDAGATVGFRSAGLELKYEVSLTQMLVDLTVAKYLPELKTMLNALIKNGVRHCVIDTVSVFDSDLNAYWTQRCNVSASTGPTDNTVYRNILVSHRELNSTMRQLPFRTVTWLSHSKWLGEGMKPELEAKRRRATLAPGVIEVMPGITGAARDNVYIANTDHVFALLATESPQQKGAKLRKLHTRPYQGFMAGGRHEDILDPIESPNMADIVRKIENFENQKKSA